MAGFPNTNDSLVGFCRPITRPHLPGAGTASALGKDAWPPGRAGTMCPSPKEDISSCVLLGSDVLMLQTLNQFRKPFYRC